MVQVGKNPHCPAPAAKAELQAAPGFNETGCQIHDFLHHGTDPAALCPVPHRPGPGQSGLSEPAQDVVRAGTSQDQRIGGELAGRQAFDVQVEARPPALEGDLGHQQRLAPLVDGALGDPEHPQRLGEKFILPDVLDRLDAKCHAAEEPAGHVQ